MNSEENKEKEKTLNNRSFKRHPSILLNKLYQLKTFQGANPEYAEILFVGRDPNWHHDIENMPVFKMVDEYLKDGPAYWKKNNFHHPFISREYKGDGKRYHKMFSKLNIDSNHSQKISFVELIGFPTTGMANKNKSEFKRLLLSEANQKYLIQLDRILSKKDKIIFVAWGLLNDFQLLNRELGLFEKLAKIDSTQMDITELNQIGNIFIHKHFSDSISNKTIAKISFEVNNCFK